MRRFRLSTVRSVLSTTQTRKASTKAHAPDINPEDSLEDAGKKAHEGRYPPSTKNTAVRLSSDSRKELAKAAAAGTKENPTPVELPVKEWVRTQTQPESKNESPKVIERGGLAKVKGLAFTNPKSKDGEPSRFHFDSLTSEPSGSTPSKGKDKAHLNPSKSALGGSPLEATKKLGSGSTSTPKLESSHASPSETL